MKRQRFIHSVSLLPSLEGFAIESTIQSMFVSPWSGPRRLLPRLRAMKQHIKNIKGLIKALLLLEFIGEWNPLIISPLLLPPFRSLLNLLSTISLHIVCCMYTAPESTNSLMLRENEWAGNASKNLLAIPSVPSFSHWFIVFLIIPRDDESSKVVLILFFEEY